MWTRHIQNPVIGHYSAIFRYIWNPVQQLPTQRPGIFGIMEYSEHSCIPMHIQNLVIFMKIYKYSELWHLKHATYSKPSQRRKIEFFAKIVQNYNYFSKALQFRSFSTFWIRLSLNKYLLTYDLALYLGWYIFRTLPIIVISGIFTSYWDRFSKIVTYLEHSVTCIFRSLPYSESWHN